MKIEEAIEILTDLHSTLPQLGLEERRKAVRLGIEALKCIQRLRQSESFGYLTNLAGEANDWRRTL